MGRFGYARSWPIAGVILLAISSAAYAASSTVQKQASAKTEALLQAKQQQLAQHQAQVIDLQQEVVKQEAASRQAADRLKQQDEAIAKMQQELQALHPAPAAGHR